MSNKLIPELRFPEFDKEGEWEKKKLGDCLDYIQPTDFLVRSTAYDNSFKTPVLTAGKTFILGYTNEVDNIFKEKLPVIIFDDFTTASQYVDFPFKAKSSAMKILISKNDIDVKFSYELMQMIRYEVGVHGRHWISVYSNLEVPVPENPKEQQKIASCLSSLDEVITAHSQKLELLKDHKKGLMQNFFPQEDEMMPKYRFKEFGSNGEWVEKKLGEVFASYSGGTPSTQEREYYGGIIPFIRSAEIGKNSTELFLTEIGLKSSSAKMVEKGDLLVALYGANSGDVAISKINGAINQAVLCLKSDFSNEFTFHYLLHKKNWIVKKYLQGGQGNLSGDIVKSIELMFPTKKEQQKIASCLSSLDALITLQVEKIEQLKLHKKGLMQGLFPKIND